MVVSALDDGGEDEGKDDIVILRTLSVWETAAEGEKGNLSISESSEKVETNSWPKFYKNMTYSVDKPEMS